MAPFHLTTFAAADATEAYHTLSSTRFCQSSKLSGPERDWMHSPTNPLGHQFARSPPVLHGPSAFSGEWARALRSSQACPKSNLVLCLVRSLRVPSSSSSVSWLALLLQTTSPDIVDERIFTCALPRLSPSLYPSLLSLFILLKTLAGKESGH
jgi:hypothetical protein